MPIVHSLALFVHNCDGEQEKDEIFNFVSGSECLLFLKVLVLTSSKGQMADMTQLPLSIGPKLCQIPHSTDSHGGDLLD